jgi:uncharacterized protein (DUF2141 family)
MSEQINLLFTKFMRWAASLILLSACARQLPPPGGPEDRTPPKILAAAPEQNATRVSLATRPRFVFSEKIDRQSFAQAFFVSPPVQSEKPIRFRWRGKEVEAIFPDSLHTARTYVINLGTDVRDLHGNRLAGAFTLAFSTGDSIDTGAIHGKILFDKPAGVLMMAYLRRSEQEPNPARDFADYFTQAGEKGDFLLSHLGDGRYRIFALQDGNGDRLYNHGEEPIGVPLQDVMLSPAAREYHDLNLRLALADTIQPRLAGATAADQTHLELNFEEEVAPVDSIWPRHLRLIAASGDTLKIFAAYPHPLNARQIHALTGLQQATNYTILLHQIIDAAGNELDSLSRQSEFTGRAQPDTSRPRIVRLTPADSSRNVAVTNSVEMIFSEMLANSPPLINYSLKKIENKIGPLAMLDSTGKTVQGKGVWLNPLQFRFQPDTLLKSRAQYFVKIFADSTFDPSGNALFDTLEQITFWTMNADTLTSISGTLTDAQPDATGTVHLTLKQVGAFSGSAFGAPTAAARSSVEYSLILPTPGPYRFAHILPGLYQLSGFRDANKNGRYDFGVAFPFVPSERFMVWPDTMKVRSRWPNEGNDFVLP